MLQIKELLFRLLDSIPLLLVLLDLVKDAVVNHRDPFIWTSKSALYI